MEKKKQVKPDFTKEQIEYILKNITTISNLYLHIKKRKFYELKLKKLRKEMLSLNIENYHEEMYKEQKHYLNSEILRNARISNTTHETIKGMIEEIF